MIGTMDMGVRFRLQDLLDQQDPPMNQSELSRRSGVSLVTVNNIVNNRTARVDLATIDALCAVLGVEPGELLEREAPRKRGAR